MATSMWQKVGLAAGLTVAVAGNAGCALRAGAGAFYEWSNPSWSQPQAAPCGNAPGQYAPVVDNRTCNIIQDNGNNNGGRNTEYHNGGNRQGHQRTYRPARVGNHR